MNASELHRRAMELFDQACELPPAERKTLLAQACAGNAELQRKVEGMLRQDAATDGLSDTGAVEAIQQLALQVTESDFAADGPPTTIGAYRIVQQVGHGGMGVIYEATQESPHRRVALKVVRSGVLSREMLRRFQREAHVLGQLQHPGIAQIYEAGVAEMGSGRRPYFAMEFIDGLPLDRHVESHRLTTSMRLELVARVCDAVQYAHQKGIIHRDLKPANVLVVAPQTAASDRPTRGTTLVDSIGLPKVLDFGIARFADADAHAVTAHTEIGQFIGTLAYMSPEQIVGNHADLDTRCDIYALGVMLYELLAGRRPHEITGLSAPEAARVVRDEEPTRLGALDRAFKGDIETMVAKAMEKDRERRYSSAAELAADIRRHLNDEPIDARPATTLYQLIKFAKRNKGLVVGAGAGLIALVAGLGMSLYGLNRARAESERAKQALADVRLVADFQGAVIESANVLEMGQLILTQIAERVGDDAAAGRLRQALHEVNPADLARGVMDGALLSRASQAAGTQFADRPKLEADLREYLAKAYFGLAMNDKGLREAEAALALRQAALGENHLDTIRMLSVISMQLIGLDRLEEAETHARDALRRFRAILPGDDRLVLETRHRLVLVLREQGRHQEALELAEPLLADAKHVLPADDEMVLFMRRRLVSLYELTGSNEEALVMTRELLEDFKRRYGEDNELTLACWSHVASCLGRLGRLAEAEAEYLNLIARAERTLGAQDIRTMRALHSLATAQGRLGHYADARATLEETLRRQRAALPAGHSDIRDTEDALQHLSEIEAAETTGGPPPSPRP